MDRKLTETLSASGTAYGLTQYSYDSSGRLECTAVRMNPAAYTSLPSSACTLGTAGSHGPDRITRNVYDAAGQVTKVQKAFGTADQQDYASYLYSLNGKQTRLTDANGNPATMTYDGFDREVQWNFPSATTPGTVSTSDYEAYTYDPGGNRLTLRKRDGVTLTYQYDDAGRLALKTVPASASGGAGYSVAYGYDATGAETYARFGSAWGLGITTAYDGFGRVASSGTTMDGTARTLSYAYDTDGNAIALTSSAGPVVQRQYDGADRIAALRWGAYRIAAFAYDAAGRRSSLGLGIDSVTSSASWTYDGPGRLQTLGGDFAGTASDRTLTFAYNAAHQIVGRTISNEAYVANSAYDVSRAYSVNGLNQYTAAGSATFTYDLNGNLTGDGTNSYVYDAENRLVSAARTVSGVTTTVATLAYDPHGRLWQVTSPSGTRRLVYDGDRLVEEYDPWSLIAVYVHGPGADEPLMSWDAATGWARRYLHADHQGSIVALADDDGNAASINAYDEWGIPNAANQGRFGYTGQAWLPELGMWYYKARIYSPTLGRFLQTDPVGYQDQVNLYAYVGDDPTNRSDPTGLCSSIKDAAVRLDCLKKRESSVEAAKEYLQTQSVSSGKKEPAYIATFDENTGNVSVRTGDSAAVRTGDDVHFTGEGGKQLEALPDGRIMDRGQGKQLSKTNQIILTTGHGHPHENPGGAAQSRAVDRDAESITNNPDDRDLSRIAPAVIKTPSGQIKVFVNGKEVKN